MWYKECAMERRTGEYIRVVEGKVVEDGWRGRVEV
jgi:hypothetical protein